MERSTVARKSRRAAGALLAVVCLGTGGSPSLLGETLGNGSDAGESADIEWRTGISYTASERTLSDPMKSFIWETLQNQFSELFETFTQNSLSAEEKEWLLRKAELRKEYEQYIELHQQKTEEDETYLYSSPARSEFKEESQQLLSLNDAAEQEIETYREMLEQTEAVPVVYTYLQESVPFENKETAAWSAAEYGLDEIIGIELLEQQDSAYIHMYSCRFQYEQDDTKRTVCSFRTYETAEFSYETVSSIETLFYTAAASLYSQDAENRGSGQIPLDNLTAGKEAESGAALNAATFIGIYPPAENSIFPFRTAPGRDNTLPGIFSADDDNELLLKRSGYEDIAVTVSASDAVSGIYFEPAWLSALNSLDKRQSEFYRRLFTALESLAVTSIVYGLHAEKHTPQVTDLWDICLGLAAGVPVLLTVDAALELGTYMRMNSADDEQ